MTAYRQPVFLSSDDHPTNRVRCAVHGFIHYSTNERQIIGHPLFQRLRYIRQLALTEFVYPGANHTRFEHSLGVMQVATDAFDMLASKYGDRLEAEFQTVAGFETKPLAWARQILRFAALLHDVGHAAFSHAAEEAVHKDLGHEALSIYLLESDDHLGRPLDAMYGRGFAKRVAQVLKGQPELPPQLQVLRDVVAGEMDADRSDYLVRDSHHYGVDYGRFEYRRLLESMELGDDAGRLELALNRDGLHVFEGLILARYQMNTQVYYHRLRRIYDQYLIRYHHALGGEAFDTAEKIVGANDITMLSRIMECASSDIASEASKWARHIIARDHHRVVFAPGIHVVGGHDLKAAARVFEAVKTKYSDFEFLLDAPKKPVRIHKLLMPNDEMEAGGVDLMLVSSTGPRRPVSRSSQILSTIPKTFRPMFIFGNVESKSMRKEIGEYAAQEWNAAGGTL
jgi:uncharacterized protein